MSDICVGNKLQFQDSPIRWTIRGMTSRYAVMTARQRSSGDVYYTILDNQTMKRGPHNLIFNPYDVARKSGIRRLIRDLESGAIELSRRRSVNAYIDDHGITAK